MACRARLEQRVDQIPLLAKLRQAGVLPSLLKLLQPGVFYRFPLRVEPADLPDPESCPVAGCAKKLARSATNSFT